MPKGGHSSSVFTVISGCLDLACKTRSVVCPVGLFCESRVLERIHYRERNGVPMVSSSKWNHFFQRYSFISVKINDATFVRDNSELNPRPVVYYHDRLSDPSTLFALIWRFVSNMNIPFRLRPSPPRSKSSHRLPYTLIQCCLFPCEKQFIGHPISGDVNSFIWVDTGA